MVPMTLSFGMPTTARKRSQLLPSIRAKLMRGDPGSTEPLERRFAGVAFVGQHARADWRGGVMAHSFSSLGIQTMLMNGKPGVK